MGTKFWYNAKTGESRPVNDRNLHDYHYDFVENDPESFGLSTKKAARMDSEKLLISAMKNHWVRANAPGADGREYAVVHGGNLEDVRKCVNWMIDKGMIADSLYVEIMSSKPTLANFYDLTDWNAIKRFARSGSIN